MYQEKNRGRAFAMRNGAVCEEAGTQLMNEKDSEGQYQRCGRRRMGFLET